MRKSLDHDMECVNCLNQEMTVEIVQKIRKLRIDSIAHLLEGKRQVWVCGSIILTSFTMTYIFMKLHTCQNVFVVWYETKPEGKLSVRFFISLTRLLVVVL
jgi:hypothetical protein